MRILDYQNKAAINKLVKVIQEYCQALLAAPQSHNIFQLEDLSNHLDLFIQEIGSHYPSCNPLGLQGAVNSYLTFEIYKLYYNEIAVISILSRKTEFEEAFREEDDLKYGTSPSAHRYRYDGVL